MTDINQKLAKLEEGQRYQEKQLDRLVSVTEQLASVHTTLQSHDSRITKVEELSSQNAKTIAKWVLICTIGFGLLARYFPELGLLPF